MKTKAPLQTGHDGKYASRAMSKSEERSETDAVRKAVAELGNVIYKHHGISHRLIKEFNHLTHQNFVSCEQIQHALYQLGHTFRLATLNE